MTEGDRKDNDCDFHIDEEIGDGVGMHYGFLFPF